MRLEPLYRLRFRYPEAWYVELDGERGVESEHFFVAEGRCEGRLAGRFRGDDDGVEIVLDVAELIWEPLDD